MDSFQGKSVVEFGSGLMVNGETARFQYKCCPLTNQKSVCIINPARFYAGLMRHMDVPPLAKGQCKPFKYKEFRTIPPVF